ncbi:MAG TPA: hypothetical protein VKE98_08010 [Gemmataceae bacterium]|nr:hypothetical protein [Gemmataceae bacterium]
MVFDFVPYQGAGNIRFGTSQEEVEEILGKPNLKRENWLGEMEFIYSPFNIGFGKTNQVCEITFFPEATVSFDGVNIMALPSGRSFLVNRSKEQYLGGGSIVLTDLGVSISHHEDSGNAKTITVFSKGRMDSMIGNYEKLV